MYVMGFARQRRAWWLVAVAAVGWFAFTSFLVLVSLPRLREPPDWTMFVTALVAGLVALIGLAYTAYGLRPGARHSVVFRAVDEG
jgi:hypothetical protein